MRTLPTLGKGRLIAPSLVTTNKASGAFEVSGIGFA